MVSMPRLSIYKPEKGNDYKFLDRNINEMFQVGGVDIFYHKYIGPYDQGATNKDGPASPTLPNYEGATNETTIQDLLFLENRDRKYDPDVYIIRGIYNVQDTDFNLSQFGMFLQNDTLFLTVHLNDTIERLGRKPMSGDVIEFPNLKDEYSLDASIPIALKSFYVVEDVNRAAEGFSPTYWPHLYRLKLKTLVDSQEFRDILGDATKAGTLASYMSTYNKEKQINDAIVNQAQIDDPKSGYNYKEFYVTPVDARGNVRLNSVNDTVDTVSNNEETVNNRLDSPISNPYAGYMGGDGFPPNGYLAGADNKFPTTNVKTGDYFLRVDYLPNRLFRYDGNRWVKIQDAVRMTTTNDDTRNTFKTSFINNSGTTVINGLTVEQRQSLSDALKPLADN
jgi:hypothetical protein